jgi:hypothetical protein
LLRRGHPHAEPEPGHPLFAASLGLCFALVAFGVHDSLVTLTNKSDDGLTGAIRLTTAFPIVPGTVTLVIGVPAALSGCRVHRRRTVFVVSIGDIRQRRAIRCDPRLWLSPGNEECDADGADTLRATGRIRGVLLSDGNANA